MKKYLFILALLALLLIFDIYLLECLEYDVKKLTRKLEENIQVINKNKELSDKNTEIININFDRAQEVNDIIQNRIMVLEGKIKR